MEAKELRLGNLITDAFGQIHKVTAGTLMYLQDADEKQSENIKPIPLTKEWLLKFGFSKEKYHSFSLKTKGFQIDFEIIKNSVYGCFLEGVGLDINYVHELQNLYFSLMREELIIKL